MNNGIELASVMGVDINQLQKAWGRFQQKKTECTPLVNIAGTKILLTPREMDFLLYLGLESITENIQKIIEKGKL